MKMILTQYKSVSQHDLIRLVYLEMGPDPNQPNPSIYLWPIVNMGLTLF